MKREFEYHVSLFTNYVLLSIRPVSVIVEFIYRPAMLVRKVEKLGKSRIAKAEAGPGVVGLRHNTYNCMHDLI